MRISTPWFSIVRIWRQWTRTLWNLHFWISSSCSIFLKITKINGMDDHCTALIEANGISTRRRKASTWFDCMAPSSPLFAQLNRIWWRIAWRCNVRFSSCVRIVRCDRRKRGVTSTQKVRPSLISLRYWEIHFSWSYLGCDHDETSSSADWPSGDDVWNRQCEARYSPLESNSAWKSLPNHLRLAWAFRKWLDSSGKSLNSHWCHLFASVSLHSKTRKRQPSEIDHEHAEEEEDTTETEKTIHTDTHIWVYFGFCLLVREDEDQLVHYSVKKHNQQEEGVHFFVTSLILISAFVIWMFRFIVAFAVIHLFISRLMSWFFLLLTMTLIVASIAIVGLATRRFLERRTDVQQRWRPLSIFLPLVCLRHHSHSSRHCDWPDPGWAPLPLLLPPLVSLLSSVSRLDRCLSIPIGMSDVSSDCFSSSSRWAISISFDDVANSSCRVHHWTHRNRFDRSMDFWTCPLVIIERSTQCVTHRRFVFEPRSWLLSRLESRLLRRRREDLSK